MHVKSDILVTKQPKLIGWLWSLLNGLDFAVSGILFLLLSLQLRLKLSNSGAVLRNKAAIRALTELLGNLKACRILDLGGGSGGLSAVFRNKRGELEPQVVIFDLDFGLLTKPNHIGQMEKNILKVCGNGASLPFKDESFDAVAMVHSLEHISENVRSQLADEIKCVARLGVVISGPAGPDAIELSHRFIKAMISRGMKVPRYAYEHLQMGVPRLEWFEKCFPGCRLKPRRNLLVEYRTAMLEHTPVLRWLSSYYYHHFLLACDNLPPYVEWTVIWEKALSTHRPTG
jgi:SAM-dependent methyltransferase